MLTFQFPFRRDELCNADLLIAAINQTAKFQFPFRRDELCNCQASIYPSPEKVSGFNSLFVGMSFAIFCGEGMGMTAKWFQFPFRRDELCNSDRDRGIHGPVLPFQFPFRRDELCNLVAAAKTVRFRTSFNSLFVGMSFAMMLRFSSAISSIMRFNSLFVGMSFAMKNYRL